MAPNSALAYSIRTGAVALAAVTLLAACGANRDQAATQTAAKVEKREITVHQINFVLQQQRNLRPEQADAAGRQILERLIDQELLFQKAQDLKIDRDPRVVQQLEAGKREIIARAYVERVGESAPKPTPEEIRKYYQDKPALFAERRIFNLQEIAIDAKPEQGALLREKLSAGKNMQEFIDFLRANDFRFTGNQAVRAAEQLPLASLDTFARLQDGQALINATPSGFQVIVLLTTTSSSCVPTRRSSTWASLPAAPLPWVPPRPPPTRPRLRRPHLPPDRPPHPRPAAPSVRAT